MGDPIDSDIEILGRCGDSTADLGARLGPGGRWLAVTFAHGLSATNEVWLADVHANPIGRPQFWSLGPLYDGWSLPWPAVTGRSTC